MSDSVRAILEAYQVPQLREFTFRNGVLRLGNEVISLPIAESYRLNIRVGLALLYWYFTDEPNAERKAWALHYALGTRLTIYEGWSMPLTDLNNIVAELLCAGVPHTSVQLLSGQRRDVIRQLAQSEQILGRRPQ